MDKPPMKGLAITAALVVLCVIFIIGSIAEGTAAFISDGGGIWFIIIGALLLIVYILRRATKLRG